MSENVTGERIKKLADSMGIKQNELAKRSGVSEVTISRYVKNVRLPSAENLISLAKVMHTTTDYLLGYDQKAEARHGYEKQAEHFGYNNRLNQLMEECGELIAAASRYRRWMGKDKTLNGKYSGDKLKNDIAEELADVALLSGEVAYLLGISDEEILTRMHYKIDRTEGRM